MPAKKATAETARKKAAKKKTVKKAMPGRPAGKTAKKVKGKRPRKWSARVNQTSDALDLTSGIFRIKDPKRIAQSLKRTAEKAGGGKERHCNRPCRCLIFISTGRVKT